MISLKQPQVRTLEAFRNVFKNIGSPHGGYPMVGGRSGKVLDDDDDLIALRTRQEDDDWLTRFF